MEPTQRPMANPQPYPDPVTEQVANAIHAWSCPLCAGNLTSDQAHVTQSDRLFAAYLIGALGLTTRTDPTP